MNNFDPEVLLKFREGLKQASRLSNVHHYKPHIKQTPFHSNSAKGRLYIGGNRSGKTTAGVIEDIWYAMGTHPFRKTPEPPVRIRVVGVDYPDGIAKILLPEFKRWVPHGELKGGTWTSGWSERNRTLTFANGSFIEFMSYEQDVNAFAGTSRHLIHFDEEPPEPIFTECMMRLIDTGGHWIITMTPVSGMTWIYDGIYLNSSENIFVVEVDITENPHLSPEEIDTVLSLITDEAEKEARKAGKFVQLGGLVFKQFDPQRHIRDVFIPPKEWKWYASMDHGFNNPTAWHWHAVAPNGDLFTFYEHYAAEMTVEQHATIVKQVNGVLQRVPDLTIGDPAIKQRSGVTGDSIQLEYNKHGVGIVTGNNDQITGVNKMNTYLRNNKWFITENCTNLLKEMQRVRWETYTSKKIAAQKNAKETIHAKDNHCTDGCRYLFTFMPDLAPEIQIDTKKEINKIVGESIGSVQGIDPDRAFDWSLVYPQQSREWTIIDEHVGGLW